MFVSINQHFVVLLLISVWHSTHADYNVTAYCTLVKTGTKLPSTKSCGTYYECQRGGYIEKVCDNLYHFDKDNQRCAPANSVQCFYGLDNPCINKHKDYVPDIGVCGGYIWCVDNKEVGRDVCPPETKFNALTRKCEYGDCGTTDPNDSKKQTNNICDIMPLGMYYGNNIDCAQYQVCLEDNSQPQIGSCPIQYQNPNLVYDAPLGKCNYKSQADCSRINGQLIPGTGGEEACNVEGAIKPNANTCSEYYVCKNEKWTVQSCNGDYWDVLDNKCKPRKAARPAEGCDRCEGTRSQFVNAVDSTCTSYLVCASSKKVGKSAECESGYYFNEARQACFAGSPIDYAKTNGACSAAPLECKCDVPNSKTNKCISPDGCLCGLAADASLPTCVLCNTTVDAETGVCQDGVCNCAAQGTADECAAADAKCECGLDADDATKCVTCTNGIDAGVCKAAACDCENTTADKCAAANPNCNCGLDASATPKCVTCTNGIDAGVCKAAACDCENTTADRCAAANPDCNCGLDASDATKCVTCTNGNEAGVCKTAACDCDNTTAEECAAANPDCNCGLDASDATKCVTCTNGNEAGVCKAAACDCDNTTAEECAAANPDCNCGLDASDATKCVTCTNGNEAGVCKAAACDCDNTTAEECAAANPDCNCGLDASDATKCVTCTNGNEAGVCKAAACDCDNTTAEECAAANPDCNCGLDASDATKCVTCTNGNEAGVCKPAACDCDNTTAEECAAANPDCNCGLDASDATKCVTCTNGNEAGVCKADE